MRPSHFLRGFLCFSDVGRRLPAKVSIEKVDLYLLDKWYTGIP